MIIDLTLSYSSQISGFSSDVAKTVQQNGWNATNLHIYSHAGTHMDAPYHFAVTEERIDEIPVERFISKAHVVSIEIIQSQQLISVLDFASIEHKIQPGESIIIKTGWSNFSGTDKYRNELPRISKEAAEWLVSRKVNMLAVEPPSVADVNNLPEVTLIHQILLGGNIIIVEGICNTAALTKTEIQLIALPLKILKGDGAPARVIAIESQMNFKYNDIINALPNTPADELLPAIQLQLQKLNKTIIVLDDDPTGTQTMHHVPVLTVWDETTIITELNSGTPLFYILTNSRSLPANEADALNQEIGKVIKSVFDSAGKQYIIISRSDSTLRGHYPNEVTALARGLGLTNYYTAIIPAFFEGGRFTIDDVHYVKEGEELICAGETAFAKDKAFGFTASNLKEWVEEKTKGEIIAAEVGSFSIQQLRNSSVEHLTEKIKSLPPSSAFIINAANYYDLEKFALAYLQSGVEVIFRTAASFVKAISGTESKALLTQNELTISGNNNGGLIIVGSYVPKTTKQLQALHGNKNLIPVEINVEDVLKSNISISLTANDVEKLISSGKDVVIYTSRVLKAGSDEKESLAIGNKVSDFITAILAMINVVPNFIIAKGGITSSDIATKALKIKRALVLGQALPGVPVWRAGEESKFPGLPYIIFPGNVGDENALKDLYIKLSS